MKTIYYGIIAILAIGAIMIYVTTPDDTKTFDIQLPSYALVGGLTDVGGTQIDVGCSVFALIQIVDDKGAEIANFLGSSGIFGSPSFTIVNPSDDRPVGLFAITPQAQCFTLGADIVIESSDLTLRVYDDSRNLQFIESLRFVSGEQSIAVGEGGIKNLGFFSFTPDQVANQLPNTDFTSTLSMEITGNLKLHYDIFPDNQMIMPINQGLVGGVWVYENNQVVEAPPADTDGDNIPDDIDQCPTQRETFNGFEDTDGCPDAPPNQAQDTDNDGIIDILDLCPTQPEVYNNFMDTDGCPDSQPETIPVESSNPINLTTCNGLGNTWYVTGDTISTSGVCATQFDPANTCDIYSLSLNQCIDGTVGTQSTETIPEGVLPFKVGLAVNFGLNDGTTQAIQIQDAPKTDFEINPFAIVNRDTTNTNKRLSVIEVNPRILLPNSSIHGLTTVTDSDISVSGVVKYTDPSNQLHTFNIPSKSISNFVPVNGGSVSDITTGLSLGTVEFRSVDIEGLIGAQLIGIGQEGDIDIDLVTDGTVGLIINDGGQIKEFSNVDVSGATISLNDFKIFRGTSVDGTTTGQLAELNIQCKSDEVIKAISGGGFLCIPDPKQLSSFVPMCMIGEPNCEICTDSASGVGGFPCNLEYRVQFCGNTNSCSAEGNGGLGLTFSRDDLDIGIGDILIGDINGDGNIDVDDVNLLEKAECDDINGTFLEGIGANVCVPPLQETEQCMPSDSAFNTCIDPIAVIGSLSCVEGVTVIQCAEAFTGNLDEVTMDLFGVDGNTFAGVVIFFIIIIVIGIVYSRRNRY